MGGDTAQQRSIASVFGAFEEFFLTHCNMTEIPQTAREAIIIVALAVKQEAHKAAIATRVRELVQKKKQGDQKLEKVERRAKVKSQKQRKENNEMSGEVKEGKGTIRQRVLKRAKNVVMLANA